MSRNATKDLTTGSPMKLILGFGIPLLFGMLLVGFRFHQKGLRIYSLIAMMVFLCKLLLLDLSYQTPLLWAGAFLICGLLCFGISFAYNRIGQKNP